MTILQCASATRKMYITNVRAAVIELIVYGILRLKVAALRLEICRLTVGLKQGGIKFRRFPIRNGISGFDDYLIAPDMNNAGIKNG